MTETPWLTADAERAFEVAAATFERAAARAGRHTVDVAFGGARLRLELAGDAARDVFARAFEAAPAAAEGSAEGEADLTILAFDAASGAALAPPEADRRAAIRVGRHFATSEAQPGGHARFAVFWEPPWIYGYDLARRVAYFHCPDAAEMPTWTRSQPFLRLLHAWTRTRGRHVAHGAAIGLGGRGLLLTAPGGSGKSTLAIAAHLAGWDYLGDDYVALDAADPALLPRAYGLYRIAKLVPAHLARVLPEALAKRLDVPLEGEKVLLELPLTRLPGGLPLAAIVVPEVTPGEARLTPIGPGRALRALAPSTVMQLPGSGAADFAALAALTRRLPAYHLAVGAHLDAALHALATLLGGQA